MPYTISDYGSPSVTDFSSAGDEYDFLRIYLFPIVITCIHFTANYFVLNKIFETFFLIITCQILIFWRL